MTSNAHDFNRRFTANMLDGRDYLVMWSKMMGCFIRWTWVYPCLNERIVDDA